MCRGFQPIERDQRLKIKAFYLHLSFSNSQKKPFPDSLTLHFLPRINGGSLEINGSSIRSDSPAFITMHRVVSAEKVVTRRGVVYGSREKLKASEGSQFEIYMNDAKILRGIFRKDDGENWKLECKCVLEDNDQVDFFNDADVCVAVDERQAAVMNAKVEMVRRRKRRCFKGLEEIPEVSEEEIEFELEDGGGGDCCCDECSSGGSDEIMMAEGGGGDCEMEGVKWAVDVGIWVMCLGVGYLVSKASVRRFRRTSLF